jgi:hypothetical protein
MASIPDRRGAYQLADRQGSELEHVLVAEVDGLGCCRGGQPASIPRKRVAGVTRARRVAVVVVMTHCPVSLMVVVLVTHRCAPFVPVIQTPHVSTFLATWWPYAPCA